MSEEEAREKTENGEAASVEIAVELTHDHMEAYVSFTLPETGGRVTASEIRDALKAKGVTYGLLDDALNKLESGVESGKNTLVAKGLPPLDSEGGVEYFVPTDKPVKVKKGQKLAKITQPGETRDGMNVFNQKIPAKKGPEIRFPHTKNVTWTDEEPDVLLSTEDGYFSLGQNEISVRPQFLLDVSEDKITAWITAVKPMLEEAINIDDIEAFLKEKSITSGILEKEIRRISEEKIFDTKVVAAQGKPVVDGVDGSVKYFFDTVIQPKFDEQGNVDYKQLNIIQNVKKGDKLVEVFPPVPGESGMTVYGDEIPPKPGKEAARPAGKNASPEAGNKNVLIADMDGHVVKRGNSVEVVPLLVVKGDVDYSTGNIDFIGSVQIGGDVKSGFSVKARDDIEIEGFVEDAVIEAGGNVELKSGFGGKGDGIITAGGKIIAKFCENQSVRCGEDIVFCEYIMHCNVETKGALIVTENKGLIVGGEVFAIKGVEAKIIGNKHYTPTRIHAGVDKAINEQILELSARLANAKEKLEKIEKARQLLLTRKLLRKKIPHEQEQLLKRLLPAKNNIGKEIADIKSQFGESVDNIEDCKNAVVTVVEAVYPRTFITIFDRRTEVKEAYSNIRFTYTPEGIKAADLGEKQKAE